MLDAASFSQLLDDAGERVIGTYMDPLRVFGSGSPLDTAPYQVLVEATTRSHPVLVTASSGLFVRVPDDLSGDDPDAIDDAGFQRRLAFQEDAARSINLVLCDLALSGQVSSAASPVQMGVGRTKDGLAGVSGGGGGRESYLARAFGPMLMPPAQWMTLPRVDAAILDAALAARRSERLAEVSNTLPELVVGAYANLSRHHAAEAVLDSYVVIEQLLDHLWRAHVDAATESGRPDRLRDTRTYTSAVRVEVLLTEGSLSRELYALIEPARRDRNNVAHRAEVSIDAAQGAGRAVQAMLEAHLGTTVAPPLVSVSTSI